ncbi:hypothetical protein [Brevibacillus dissolubilis]|uniref:hypothetical protein n=1 Tax=Brevibacillus dissolubilis TaxID=1844116 RepID=UPI00159B9B3D|nr:hypothetical protein [Brevibacillus dissolubilis]
MAVITAPPFFSYSGTLGLLAVSPGTKPVPPKAKNSLTCGQEGSLAGPLINNHLNDPDHDSWFSVQSEARAPVDRETYGN